LSPGVSGVRENKKDPHHVRRMIKVSQIKMQTDDGAIVLTPALQYILPATPFYTLKFTGESSFCQDKIRII